MRFRLTPRDDSFVELFTRTGEVLVEATTLLTEFVGSDPVRRPALARRVEEVLHAGDEAARAVLERLESSFITPFDREDVHRLTRLLDDCLDRVHTAVELAVLHRVGTLPAGVGDLVQVIARQAELTHRAMPGLRAPRDLREYWVEVDRLERRADRIHRSVVVAVLGGEQDTLTALRQKEVVDALGAVADAFEQVARTVELIAVKGS